MEFRVRIRTVGPRALAVVAVLLAVVEAFDAPGVAALGFAISGILPVAALRGQCPREPVVVAAAAGSIAMTLLAAALPQLRAEHTFGLVEAAALSWLLVRVAMDWPLRRLLRLLPPLFLAVTLLPLRLATESLGNKGNGGVVLGFGAAFAILLGLHLRQLQRYRADALRAARQAQRLEYARDLHDFVAHHVTAIVAQTRAVRYTTGSGQRVEAERLDALLADIERAGTEAMTSMRAMVGTLREETPSALPYRTIGEVVAALTDSFADPGMTAVCSVDAGLAHRAVPVDTLVAVHHTIQEALTNVMRHAAGATRVEIGVRPLAGSVEITVTDDGGNAPAASTAAGFGLRGLGERMETVGGSLAAGPGPHGGWRVTATLPLSSRSRLRSYVA